MNKNVFYACLLSISIFAACNSQEKKDEKSKDSVAVEADTTLTHTDDAAKLDTADINFFEKAAYGGLTEVESSNMILQRTKDPEVKGFAEMMVKDHGAANQKLKALAQEKGYLLPSQLPKTRLGAIAKMDTFKDEGRDEYYIQLMIDEHRKAIDIFSLASRSKDMAISTFASTLLPTLNHHYQHTLRIDSLFKAAKANQGDDPLKLSDRKKK